MHLDPNNKHVKLAFPKEKKKKSILLCFQYYFIHATNERREDFFPDQDDYAKRKHASSINLLSVTRFA